MTTPSTASVRWRGDGEAERNWSDLPEGPLHTILLCLCSLVDLISFKSVCRSWRAVGSSLSSSLITSRFPPLLLFPARPDGEQLSGFGVFDPASPSFFSEIPFNSDKFKFLCHIGYSHGHLLGLLGNRVAIINLLTGGEFYSPILPENDSLSSPTHRIYFQPTFYALTSPLSSPDSGVLVFSRGPLLNWRIGSVSWSYHWPETKIKGDLGFITVQGTVYAMNSLDYSLSVVELSPELHLRPLEVEGIKKESFFLEHFLVDCGGELLHVRLMENEEESEEENEMENDEENDEWRARFEVVRLDLSVNGPRWVKKETLGNWAIFVGSDFRLPGLAVENPERWGGRSNSVYFSKVNEKCDPPFAVLNLGEEFDMSDVESPLHHARCISRLSSEWFHPCFPEM